MRQRWECNPIWCRGERKYFNFIVRRHASSIQRTMRGGKRTGRKNPFRHTLLRNKDERKTHELHQKKNRTGNWNQIHVTERHLKCFEDILFVLLPAVSLNCKQCRKNGNGIGTNNSRADYSIAFLYICSDRLRVISTVNGAEDVHLCRREIFFVVNIPKFLLNVNLIPFYGTRRTSIDFLLRYLWHKIHKLNEK